MNRGRLLMAASWTALMWAGCAPLTYTASDPDRGTDGSITVGAGGGGGGARRAASSLDRTVVPEPGDPKAMTLPEVQDYTLDNGMRVVLVERTELPLVSLEIQFRGGASAHSTARAGLAALTADMLDEGTTSRSALEIADAVDYLGASLSSTAGYDASQLRLSVLRTHFPEALAILADVIMNPTFPPQEIERLRAERIARVLQRTDVPAALADDAFFEVLYGPEHPYGSSLLGTKETLSTLTRDELVAFHAARYAPGQATLVVVGDVEREALDSLLSAAFTGWSGHGEDPPEPPAPLPTAGRTIYVVDKPGAAQSEIRVGRVALARRTGAYFAATVANTVLGGSFTSRLNANLREEKGYTYGAGSYFDMRRAPGPFEAAAAVDSAVTDSAVMEFVREIDRMHQEGVPSDELDRARNYVALRLPQRFETIDDVGRRLAELVLYDIPLDFWSGYVAGIDSVDAGAVRQVAGEWFNTDVMAIVIAGDRASIEEPLRALGLGPVVVRP